MLRKNLLKKLLSFYLSLFLLFGPFFSFSVFAEEEPPVEEQGEVVVEVVEPEAIATEPVATIETGDASAQVSTETEVNTNVNLIEETELVVEEEETAEPEVVELEILEEDNQIEEEIEGGVCGYLYRSRK